MAAIENEKTYGLKLRESANDGSDFGTPEADYRYFWLGEDGSFHLKDSADAVTDIGPSSGIPATIFDAKGDIIAATAADTASRLAIGATDGMALTVDAAEATGHKYAIVANYYNVNVWTTPTVQTNWSTLTADTAALYAARMLSSGAQNDLIGWDLALIPGTWAVDLVYVKSSNYGIYSIQFDGVEKGTIDGYNATIQRNQIGSVTGIAVAVAAIVRVSIKMAAKNASSASYFGGLNAVVVRRTA